MGNTPSSSQFYPWANESTSMPIDSVSANPSISHNAQQTVAPAVDQRNVDESLDYQHQSDSTDEPALPIDSGPNQHQSRLAEETGPWVAGPLGAPGSSAPSRNPETTDKVQQTEEEYFLIPVRSTVLEAGLFETNQYPIVVGCYRYCSPLVITGADGKEVKRVGAYDRQDMVFVTLPRADNLPKPQSEPLLRHAWQGDPIRTEIDSKSAVIIGPGRRFDPPSAGYNRWLH